MVFSHSALSAGPGRTLQPSRLPNSAPFLCNLSPFRINTSLPSPKCSFHTTYGKHNSFRITTYEKTGEGEGGALGVPFKPEEAGLGRPPLRFGGEGLFEFEDDEREEDQAAEEDQGAKDRKCERRADTLGETA